MKKQRLGFFVVIVSLVFLAAAAAGAQDGLSIQKDESLRRGETRPTLDPSLFKDPRVKSAYQVAKDVPWLLDSIYCYCFCEESFQHKSLLSCYVDDHAAM